MKNTFILNIANKNKFSRTKQINAFMPNLIHSLDAASLGLFVEFFYNSKVEVKNFYSIHDCFGVTANNVSELLVLLKSVYIYIYSKDNYLQKLDSEIISNIKNMYGENRFNDETRIVTITADKEMKYPNIDHIIGNKLDTSSILKSSYILH